MFFGKLISNL